MLNLITDRTFEDVFNLKQLKQKKYEDFTTKEKAYYLNGNQPLYEHNGKHLIDSNGEDLLVVGGGIKGAYNYTDLNRVGSAVKYLYDNFITKYDIDKTHAPIDKHCIPKTDWSTTDIPTKLSLKQYLDNVNYLYTICFNLGYETECILPDSIDNIDYEDANNIEQTLLNAETIFENVDSNMTILAHINTALRQLLKEQSIFVSGGAVIGKTIGCAMKRIELIYQTLLNLNYTFSVDLTITDWSYYDGYFNTETVDTYKTFYNEVIEQLGGEV